MDNSVKKNLLLSFVALEVLFIAHSIHGSDTFVGYLFTYFIGNSGNEEAIRFALSDDGHTFKALNENKPVLESSEISEKGGVRDPHILRGENNDYYMVATDMVSRQGWNSNRGMVLLKSNNLVDWEHSTVNIQNTFPKYANVDRVWAPQTIYDPVAEKYMVYFSMRIGGNDPDKIYYAYTNSEFTELETEPELLFTYKPGDRILPSIDGDIIYKDSTYHLFFKTEQNGNGIKKATSKTLTGPYTLHDKYLQATNDAVEGSCVFKLNNSDTFVLMYDVYNAGRYEFTTSTDLITFIKDPKAISFDFKPRHGTVIPITGSEKLALLGKWSPTGVISDSGLCRPDISYSTTGNTLQILFGKRPVKGSVYLYDLAGKQVLYRAANDKSINIQLKTLSAGVYYVLYNTVSGISWKGRISIQ